MSETQGLYKLLGAQEHKNERIPAEYFGPDQRGVILIHKVEHVVSEDGLSQNVFLTGEVIEANAKKPGIIPHAVGSFVKRQYQLTKYPKFMPAMLDRDIMSIVGVSAKTLSKEERGGLYADVFEGAADENGKRAGKNVDSALRGVLAVFDTKERPPSEGHTTGITEIRFQHLDESKGNSEAEIAARRAKM